MDQVNLGQFWTVLTNLEENMDIWRVNGFDIHLATRQLPSRNAEVYIQAVQNHWGDRVNIGDSACTWWQITLLAKIITLCTTYNARVTYEFTELTQQMEDES
jgi:hypothetical protein